MPDAVTYTRVSTEEQAREDRASLGQQVAALEALAAAHGLAIVARFEDPGASGGTANRPGFQQLLAWCDAHPRPADAPGTVLVFDGSRWGRFDDPEEAAYWRHHLRRLGWRVRYAVGDAEDPMAASVLRAVHGVQSTTYRQDVIARARRGARGAAEAGWWGRRAPLGYARQEWVPGPGGTLVPGRVLASGEHKADTVRVKLVPGAPEDVAMVRWLFDRAAEGVPLGAIAREAAARWPGRSWCKQGVRQVVRNPAYLGRIVLRAKRPDGGTDTVVTANAHPALVSELTFAAVAARLARNRHAGGAVGSGYALTGILTCAHCGEPWIGGGGRRGPAHDPDRHRFYLHRGRSEGRASCPGSHGVLPRRWLDARVVDTVAVILNRPDLDAGLAAALDAELADARAAAPTRERERRRLEAKRERLVAAVADGLVTDAEARNTLGALRREIEALAGTEARQAAIAGAARLSASERSAWLAKARELTERCATLPAAAVRALLAPWVRAAVVDRPAGQLTLSLSPPVAPLRISPGLPTLGHNGLEVVIPLPPGRPSQWR